MSESVFVARCRLLATLAVADDDVAPEEIEFLERAMDRLQLSEQERLQAMTVLTEQETAAAITALSPIERLAFLVELAELAWADKRLDPGEVERIEQIAAAMGFEKDDVSRALDEARPTGG